MSRRSPNPSSKRSREWDKPPQRDRRPAKSDKFNDGRSGEPSVKFIVITAALASLASAVFLFDVLRPTSFLSAVRGVEVSAISRATWDKIYDEYRSRLSTDPVVRTHDSVSRLLSLLIEVERGWRTAAEALPAAALPLDVDRDNLVSRLTYAVLEDHQVAPAGGATRPPMDRFAAIKRIVVGEHPATVARLYNEEFTQAWHEVLKKYSKRADVAASLATSLDHYQIVDQYAALPMLQQRLTQIAAELRAQGHSTEADTCIRWIGQTLLGLIESEKDAGTRLLCVELLQAMNGPDPQLGADLAGLRDTYHTRASAAPIDPTHSFRPPVTDRHLFRRTWNLFIAAITVFITSIGALIALVIAGVALAVRSIAGKKNVPTPIPDPQSILGPAVRGAACAALMAMACVRASSDGAYSVAWAALLSWAIIVWSALTVALVMSSGSTSGRTPQSRRLGMIALAMLAIWILAAWDPASLALFLRRVDLATGNFTIVLVALGMVAFATLFLVLKDWRALARSAAIVWMATALSALAVLQFHRIQDDRWMNHAAQARLDEFPARLGPDWQDQYLKSARTAYDMNKP